MSGGYFQTLTAEEQKKFRQRQAMIEECIDLGVFDDRDHFKSWMKDEFQLDIPVSQISTEYTLNEKQKRLLYIWLRYFTGKGPKPKVHRARARATNRQLYKMDELQGRLGWSRETLGNFIARETGKKKIPGSLFKTEATKVITGMERILAEQPFKRKQTTDG